MSAAAAQPTTRNWFGGRKAATQPASPTVPHTGAKLLCPIVKLAGMLRVRSAGKLRCMAGYCGRFLGSCDRQFFEFCVTQNVQPDAANSHALSIVAEEEDRWRRWVDAKLVRVLTINIYRNRAESFQTFDYITKAGNFSFIEREVGRVFGAATMWCVNIFFNAPLQNLYVLRRLHIWIVPPSTMTH